MNTHILFRDATETIQYANKKKKKTEFNQSYGLTYGKTNDASIKWISLHELPLIWRCWLEKSASVPKQI